MKRLIVYDLDGTLVDTSQELVQANGYVLSRLGASAERLAAVHSFTGCGIRELVTWGLQRDNPELMEAAEALFAAYYKHHANEHSRLYPGTQPLLDYFNARAQAVLTDRPNPFARDLLEALGLSSYFLDIIAGDSPYPRKPHPAGALALMAKAGVRPKDTLLIGDSPSDIETGRNAGIFTIAIAHGFSPELDLRAADPDVLVEDFTHLLGLARRHGW